MTWTKLGDDFTDNPAMRRVSRDARYLRVEALVWCNRHGTDGRVDQADLPWITDSPDADAAVAELVKGGFWSITDAGWQVVGWTREQRLAEDVARTQELTAARQRRWRQHANGDHSLCDPRHCRMAANLGEPDTVTRLVTRYETPTRPDPTRPDPKGRERGGAGFVVSLTPSGSLRSSPGEGEAWPQPAGEPVRLRFPRDGEAFMSVLDMDAPPEPDDLELGVGPAREDHVTIVIMKNLPDHTELPEDQRAEDRRVRQPVLTMLHQLAGKVGLDVKGTKAAHGCPNRAASTRQCELHDDTGTGFPMVSVTVATNRLQGWLDLLAWQLVHLAPTHEGTSTPSEKTS